MQSFFSDLHLHSTLQPFGHTFSSGGRMHKRDSLWYYRPPHGLSWWFERIFGISSYSQSNLTACGKGRVRIAGVSLYPPETSFFLNRMGENRIAEGIEEFLTSYGEKRIRHIQSPAYDYYKDLTDQYNYLVRFHQSSSPDKKYKVRITSNYSDIEKTLQEDENTLALFITIEGAHSFGCGYVPLQPTDENTCHTILSHVDEVKNWDYKPLFITLAHHFYNQICGHARSLPLVAGVLACQDKGINTGITPLGYKIIERLLDNSEGKRILIDIRHMSMLARKQYYLLLDTLYKDDHIPIIFSHGGVCGQPSFEDAGDDKFPCLFNNGDINLFDDEIIRIIRSGGIMGMNMDQRVMASDEIREEIRRQCRFGKPETIRKNWSRIIWNNIRHIAEIADRAGLPAWDNVCIGSDFDGVINPVNGFLSAEDMPRLSIHLAEHIYEYMNDNPPISTLNNIDPQVIIHKLMSENIFNFLRANF